MSPLSCYFRHFTRCLLIWKTLLVFHKKALFLTFVILWSSICPHDLAPSVLFLEDLAFSISWCCPPVNPSSPPHCLLPLGTNFLFSRLKLAACLWLTKVHVRSLPVFYKLSTITVCFHTSSHYFFFYALHLPPQLICFDRLQSLRPAVPIRYVVLSDVLRSMIFLHLEDWWYGECCCPQQV